ncbi:MAG: ABC transporter permease [Clostridium sp.]
MRTFLIYLKLELKRMFKRIPYFLGGVVVLILLVGTVAFSASKMLYADRALSKIQVGVILPTDDKMASAALSMVSSLDSVGSLCEFQYMDETEGKKRLKQGTVSALMQIPEHLVEGIMDGSNTPVTIIFPKNSGLEASVFKELTEAGTSILRTAQAGIYGADEFLTLHQSESSIDQAERDLNRIYLNYALSRESYFKTQQISAAGDVTTVIFYGISASVLVLLLMGIPAAPMLRPYSNVMEQKLSMMGIGAIKRTAAKTIALTCMLLLASLIPYSLCLLKGYIRFGAATVLMWILICMAAAGWILFLYELSGNVQAGILLVFFSAVLMLFVSGGIVPGVFLPESIGSLGAWMPSTWLMDGIKWMIKGGNLIPVGRLILMEIAVFVLASAVRRSDE